MRLVRRCGHALASLLSWAAAAFAVLWFYDWVSRWYVAVGVLLVIVGVAMAVDRAAVGVRRGAGASDPAGPRDSGLGVPAVDAGVSQSMVPAPRDGESAPLGWYAPEEKLA